MAKTKKLYRRCSVCGKKLMIIIYPDRHYRNGHFFGKPNIPIGKGEHKKIGTWKFRGRAYDVVKWTGKEKEIEMWECDTCYQEAMHEYWLECKIEELYGKRCPDYENGCACCQAWNIYDTIIADNRGEL